MLYQLNYEANVCLVSFIPPRHSLVHAISTEPWSKCMPCLLCPIKTVSGPSSSQEISGECSINWTMKQMSDFMVSFVQARQSLVNALLTELWSKFMPCLLHSIKMVPGTCSDNWTMKQMSAFSPLATWDSLRWMLYQLNYEANACIVSFIQSRQSLVHAP